MENSNNACCPKFNPEKWDGKTFVWSDKLFVKDSLPTFFHIPLPGMIDKKITRLCKAIENSNMAEVNKEDSLVLFHDPSAFRSEVYLSVADQVPAVENVRLSGVFIAKVYSGPYNAVPKFIKQINEFLVSQGKKAKDYYIHYAYCPKCAKKYGDNYMIIFAQL